MLSAVCTPFKHTGIFHLTAEAHGTTQSMLPLQCHLILLILRSTIVCLIESNIWGERVNTIVLE